MKVEPARQTVWDWRAAVQFSGGGTGTGLLFFTALHSFMDAAWLWRTGILSLIFIGIGLFAVWIKLGRRWRFAFVILNPHTSWMTREAFLSLPLGLLAMAAVILQSPVLALIAGLFGLAFLYAQARMVQAAMGIPAWREPRTVPLLFVTGLVEGIGLFLAAAFFFRPDDPLLPVLAFVLIAGRLGAWWAYRARVTTPGVAPMAAVAELERAHRPFVVGGHLLPLVLLSIAVPMPASSTAGLIAGLIAGLAALFGGWYLKFTLITRASYNQGFAITRTPARTPGYAGPGAKPGWE